jgi:hypothetical protein
MRTHVLKLSIFSLAVLVSLEARAACTKDTDCKGDRVCEKGKCVAPSDAPTAKSGAAPAGLFEPAKPAPPKDTGPTLEQSIAFIEQSLTGFHATSTMTMDCDRDGPGDRVTLVLATNYDHLSHQGCELSLTGTSVTGDTPPNPFVYKVDLKQVNSSALRVAQQPREPDAANPGCFFSRTSWNLYYGIESKGELLFLGDNGQDIGTHLANAFGRAAQLCGGKTSPF